MKLEFFVFCVSWSSSEYDLRNEDKKSTRDRNLSLFRRASDCVLRSECQTQSTRRIERTLLVFRVVKVEFLMYRGIPFTTIRKLFSHLFFQWSFSFLVFFTPVFLYVFSWFCFFVSLVFSAANHTERTRAIPHAGQIQPGRRSAVHLLERR